jgi:hypothetical protein
MFTIGADGKYHVDDATERAQQLFGLGRRKRGFLKRFSPLMRFMQMHKKHSLISLIKGKKKKGGGGGDVTDDTTAAATVPDTSQPGAPMQMTSAPAAPMDMTSQSAPPMEMTSPPPPPQAMIPTEEPPPPTYAAAAQDNTEELPQTDYQQAPDYSSGFTIRAGQEESVFNPSYAEGDETPPQSIDTGMGCCGGFIVTGPSPKQRDFMGTKSMASTLRTPPYRGLGQADDFWYRPQPEFRRKVPVSKSPSNERSLHTGSRIWGDALPPMPGADDPFNDRARAARRRHRHRGQRSGALPF